MLKTSKKIVSIMLAIVLVLSTVAVSAFAAFDPSTQTIGFVIVPDKDLTKLSVGDNVKFTLYCDVADYDTVFTAGQLWFLYNSAAYSATTTYKNLGDFAKYAKDNSATKINNANANWTKITSNTTQDISAFDSAVVMPLACDTNKDWNEDGTPNSVAAGFKMTAADGTRSVAQAEFTLTVLDPSQNMDVIICNAFAAKLTNQAFKAIVGGKSTNLTADKVNVELASAMANNPAAASILKYSKAQIRFKGITATSGPSTYEGTFDVRTIAKISQADFLAKFTSEDNAKAKITDFGFVYAAKSKVASFDLATAKAVAEGTPAENYTKAPVKYMQHTADGADYIFTCLITPIDDADKTDGVSCLAYVCFDGEYIYFDKVQTVDYSTLYALMPEA